jgi:iron complex transport system ATP-binding protein
MSLVACNVSFQWQRQSLLREVSLELRPAEVMILLGPNGSGKTTLLRTLSGELKPTSGEVRLLGRPLAAWSLAEQAKQRAVLPQSANITFPFRCRQVVLMGRSPHLKRRDETLHDHEVVAAYLRRVEMTAFAERIFPTLSGGEKARINLARILAQETRFLLLDEPTASLDPLHQRRVLELTRELAEQGCGVLAILHDLNLAAAFADRIGILFQGQLITLAEPEIALTEERLEAVFGLRFVRFQAPGRQRPAFLFA